MVHNIVHFAIHADDVERARRFYEAVFGWRFEPWGPPGFYDVSTGDDDHPGIHGALHGRDEPVTGTGTRGFTCTVAVDDLASIRERVTANGGTITYEEIEVPTVGSLTQFLDTEGNELAAMVSSGRCSEHDRAGAPRRLARLQTLATTSPSGPHPCSMPQAVRNLIDDRDGGRAVR